MILKYEQDTDDTDFLLEVQGVSTTGEIHVTITDDGHASVNTMDFAEARELVAEITRIIDRLDPPKSPIINASGFYLDRAPVIPPYRWNGSFL